MYEDSLKQLNMCTVACLNDSHLPSDTHTFHCACQSAQAQKKKKKKHVFFLAAPVTALLGVCGAGNLPSPTAPFAEVVLMLRFCILKKGTRSGTAFLESAYVKGSRHTERSRCARASLGQSRWEH